MSENDSSSRPDMTGTPLSGQADLPPGQLCPQCRTSGLVMSWTLVAKPLGTFSLSGAQMKVAAGVRAMVTHTCGFATQGRIDGASMSPDGTSFTGGHFGTLLEVMMEPETAETDSSWRRDVGPFDSLDQAMQQFGNWSAGLPQPHVTGGVMLVLEGAMLAGLQLSDFERGYLASHGVDPVLGTILSGLLIRAAHPHLPNA